MRPSLQNRADQARWLTPVTQWRNGVLFFTGEAAPKKKAKAATPA